MKKMTVHGELCPDGCDYSIEWSVDVELEDEQAEDLLNLVFFAGYTNVKRLGLKEKYPDIYDILDKACYKATLDAYNEYLSSCGKPEVDKLDFEHEVNVPYEPDEFI